MRDQANLGGDNAKWIILDGDIDPMLVDTQICRTSCLVHSEWIVFLISFLSFSLPRWIESLNTVMDDNKILTLASNERIALTPTMRLIFEISNLRTATPATVKLFE